MISFVRRPHLAVLVLLLLGGTGSAGAQGTGVVPSGDPAYAALDHLAELGVLDSIIAGQRPYSRREVARIVRVARARLDASPAATNASRTADVVLRRLDERFGDAAMRSVGEPLAGIVDGAALVASSIDDARRGFSGSITRALEASIDPVVERRVGTQQPSGHSLAIELSHRVDPTSWLSLHASERIEARTTRGSGASNLGAELLLAGVRARYRNVAVRAGREQVMWAQMPGDGLLLASDAPALDLISLSSDAPFRLPGVLGRLGRTQATLLVADLGPSLARSHSKLLAYKVSVQPRQSLELGASFMNHYGGEGGRASSLGNRFVDFLPFVDIFRGHNYTDTSRTLDVDSDKLLGVDGRLRIARLAGMILSTELVIDDFDVHRIRTLFTWDGAQSVDVGLPGIAGSPLTIHVSAKHTGVRTYTHGALSDGITTRGRLLGDELGPDAKAFGALLRWDAPAGWSMGVEGRSAIYSRADYVTVEQGAYFVIRRVGDAANELRDRAVATFASDLGGRLGLRARVAGERVRNLDFTGRSRREYAAEIALRYAH